MTAITRFDIEEHLAIMERQTAEKRKRKRRILIHAICTTSAITAGLLFGAFLVSLQRP